MAAAIYSWLSPLDASSVTRARSISILGMPIALSGLWPLSYWQPRQDLNLHMSEG